MEDRVCKRTQILETEPTSRPPAGWSRPAAGSSRIPVGMAVHDDGEYSQRPAQAGPCLLDRPPAPGSRGEALHPLRRRDRDHRRGLRELHRVPPDRARRDREARRPGGDAPGVPAVLKRFSLGSHTSNPRSHAPRGNAVLDAPRPLATGLAELEDDAERRRRHSHGGPWERVLSWAMRMRTALGFAGMGRSLRDLQIAKGVVQGERPEAAPRTLETTAVRPTNVGRTGYANPLVYGVGNASSTDVLVRSGIGVFAEV